MAIKIPKFEGDLFMTLIDQQRNLQELIEFTDEQIKISTRDPSPRESQIFNKEESWDYIK